MPQPTPLSHATGARDVVLRMSVVGGLPYPAKTIEEPPEFTLYGDDRIIHVVAQTSADGTFTTELRQAQLTADGSDALLRDALDAGGLATAAASYRDVEVFDAVSTVFEIHAGGFDKRVSVYALGLFDASAPSALARAGFRLLVDRLNEAGAGGVDLGPFKPEAYRVTLAAPFSDQEANAEWPWPELRPADFPEDSGGDRVRMVTAAQGMAVMNLGITHDLVTRAPDGKLYMIRIHPLLPDEMPAV